MQKDDPISSARASGYGNMRVLLTGGGTAGHINPALAIADVIRRNAPASEIAFVGVKGGREEDLVPREGYPLYYVESVGFARPIWRLKNLRALRLALRSPHAPETQKILDDFKPDLVIGTGGYACWPIMKAATERGIPTAVHESNAKPGLAIKRLKKQVDRIWVNFEVTQKELGVPDKTKRVGNPLRECYESISRERARAHLGVSQEQIVVLSFGGSLGADAINDAALEVMQNCGALHPEILHWHATGKRGYDATRSKFEELGLEQSPNCRIFDYFYDMPYRMAAADLIISRAGAMTISELSRLGRAAILIPSPNVVDDHQTANARALADQNAAVLIPESALPDGMLTEAVVDLLSSPARMRELQTNIHNFSGPDAGQLIWQEIVALTAHAKSKQNETDNKKDEKRKDKQ